MLFKRSFSPSCSLIATCVAPFLTKIPDEAPSRLREEADRARNGKRTHLAIDVVGADRMEELVRRQSEAASTAVLNPSKILATCGMTGGSLRGNRGSPAGHRTGRRRNLWIRHGAGNCIVSFSHLKDVSFSAAFIAYMFISGFIFRQDQRIRWQEGVALNCLAKHVRLRTGRSGLGEPYRKRLHS